MVKLVECVTKIIIEEYGTRELLMRLSDPWFFQSLSCLIGYDWHSSGTTTVTCGALKEAIKPYELGLAVAGGKGKASRKAPTEIEKHAKKFGFNSRRIEDLKYASKMTAKVDNSLVQDSYHLYHHTFIFDEKSNWIVIQQGINEKERNARRYHWPPEHKNIIEEPEKIILCDSRVQKVLNMTSKDSDENRRVCVDLAKENPRRLKRTILQHPPPHQSILDAWTDKKRDRKCLIMPTRINWSVLKKVYDFQPSNYEELVAVEGIGPSTIRGLALTAEIVFGEKASWRDPVRYSFAFGGKDGVPFPVNRGSMDEAVDILKKGIKEANIGCSKTSSILNKLRKYAPAILEDGRY